jgi:hypothetical protein
LVPLVPYKELSRQDNLAMFSSWKWPAMAADVAKVLMWYALRASLESTILNAIEWHMMIQWKGLLFATTPTHSRRRPVSGTP